jgi:hypothetical protein
MSQQDSSGAVVTARREIFWLVMDLSELLSGLSAFLRNPRTKQYGFLSSDNTCHIRFERRKRGMLLVQMDPVELLHSETAVRTAFQDAIVRFQQTEYAPVEIQIGATDGVSTTERELDREFQERVTEFLSVSCASSC